MIIQFQKSFLLLLIIHSISHTLNLDLIFDSCYFGILFFDFFIFLLNLLYLFANLILLIIISIIWDHWDFL